MQGVVSLLDDEHYAVVEGIWAELERDFGVRGVYKTPFPHLSFQVAAGYHMESVEPILREVARCARPFTVRTAGLGIFNVTHPVLYVPVVRSPALSALHERLWDEITKRGEQVSEFYRPEMWMPHITLAHNNVDYEQLSRVVRALGGRRFHWEVTLNNLSVIYDTGEEQGLRCRYDFAGENGDTRAASAPTRLKSG